MFEINVEVKHLDKNIIKCYLDGLEITNVSNQKGKSLFKTSVDYSEHQLIIEQFGDTNKINPKYSIKKKNILNSCLDLNYTNYSCITKAHRSCNLYYEMKNNMLSNKSKYCNEYICEFKNSTNVLITNQETNKFPEFIKKQIKKSHIAIFLFDSLIITFLGICLLLLEFYGAKKADILLILIEIFFVVLGIIIAIYRSAKLLNYYKKKYEK